MNDELKDLIMNASLNENEEETEFILKENTHANEESSQEEEAKSTEEDSEKTFIIPDTPIFSIESVETDIPKKPEASEKTEKRELLNIEHFSDYNKEEGVFGEIILDIDREYKESDAETYENITILSEENPKVPFDEEKTVIPEKKEDPDRIGYDPKKLRSIDSKFEFIELFVFTLLAVVLLTTFIFRHSAVKGSSMEGTLHEKDHLIISDLFYTPKKGDVIVFQDPETGKKDPLVKRVIATEGDTVEILIDGTVLVNDKPIVEDYILKEPYMKDSMPKVTVPEDMVFVLGDNRNNSSDSREFYPSRFVREDAILGKAVLRFYPNFGKIE